MRSVQILCHNPSLQFSSLILYEWYIYHADAAMKKTLVHLGHSIEGNNIVLSCLSLTHDKHIVTVWHFPVCSFHPPFGISVFSSLVAPRVSCTSLCLSVWVVSGVHVFTPCSVSCLIL